MLSRTEPITFKEGLAGIARQVRPYRKLTLFMAGLGILSAIANGAVPYVTGRFFDALVGLSQGRTSFLSGFAAWAVFLVFWAIVQAGANIADWIEDRRERDLSTKIQVDIQSNGLAHLFKLPLQYHADEHLSAVLNQISYASWRISGITRTVVSIAPQLLSVLIGLALAATINLPMTGVLMLGVAVYGLLLIRILGPAAEADEKAHRVWNDSWDDGASAVHQITAVKQAAAEDYEIGKLRANLSGRAAALWYRMELLWSDVSFFQRAIVFCVQFVVFALSVKMVADKTLSIGQLVALNGYAQMFFGPFVQLGYSWQTIQNGMTSAGLIERVFRTKTETYHPAHFKTPARTGAIAFDDVHFHYESNAREVLGGITIDIGPGTSIALVGESGAGKSTFAQLISGYYFPTKGTVRVEGLDTRAWDLTALRSGIAVVPQEVALFNESIRDNIRYGSFNASEEQIINASRRAHIHEFIASLPDGYDTLVGERGIKLSVGQKQRVAIARAMLRDPRILILDEPTSALDPETEQFISASFEELMRGRTTFIIAHRLSTVRKADTILVLKDGKIAEQGTHDDLIRIQNGAYRRLYELHIGFHE